MKKILLLIFLSVFCINAINAEVTWELSEEGTLTISGTNMPNYSNFDPYFAPWHSQCEKIKKVVINNGVTNIGNMAFFLCSGISSVTIPNSVTSIGESAFYGCI